VRIVTAARFRREHRYTAGHLSDYVDDGLAAAARARMERHCADCPDCDRALRTLSRLVARMHALAPRHTSEPPPDIAAAVRARLGDAPTS
jgi:anti-sigma factor RsiW